MKLNTVDPLMDQRWDDLVSRHPRASVFHQRGWLEALHRTYGYEPFVLTTATPGESLKDGVVLCRVKSWLTGNRLVSLPFSDHCDSLLNDSGDWHSFLDDLRAECQEQRYRYVEWRPLAQRQEWGPGVAESDSFCFHALDLRPGLQQIFDNFHKDSIQRKIRRAEREGLSYEKGRDGEIVEDFYKLLVMTRRRHQRLPQPRAWFKNLIRFMGDRSEIRVARKNGKAIAALFSLRNRSSVVYKYGCSDEKSHNLGGMPFLFWKLIEESKGSGAEVIDLGRSDWDQTGLITFKNRLGAVCSALKYHRYSLAKGQNRSGHGNPPGLGLLFPVLPNAVLCAAGEVLYKHMG